MNFVVNGESILQSTLDVLFKIHNSLAKQNSPLIFNIEKNLCKIH
jgi:hypothetical protein